MGSVVTEPTEVEPAEGGAPEGAPGGTAGAVGISAASPRPSPPLRAGGAGRSADASRSAIAPYRPSSAGRHVHSRAALRDLAGRVDVAHRPSGPRIVGEHRLAVPGCLRDFDASGDDRSKGGRTEVTAHLARHLVGELGAPVVHRQQDRRDMQRGVEVRPHEVDVAQQLAEPFQRVVLALDRDEHLIGRDEGVHREQAERRRAVDEDVVDVQLVERLFRQRLPHPVLPGDHADELDLGAGQVDRGRDAQQVRRRRAYRSRLGQPDLPEQHLVDRRGAEPVLDAERRARVALRVEVDHEHPHPVHRERGGQVDGAGGLADAALLVRDREDPAVGRARHPVALRVQHTCRPFRFLGDGCPARCFT